ncbi:MAG TPA: DUF4239 domain-containing protein [Phenylobacterium sp.]|jgi:hypothetical protein
MSYLTALLIIVASAAAAAVASLVVDRFVSRDLRRKYSDEAARIFAQLGTMFALLLAFVFSQVWAEHRTAEQAISGEVGALLGASALAHALPNHAGKPVNLAIITYANAVVDDEWPTMATGRTKSEAALTDFRLIIEQAVQLDTTGPSGVTIQSQILSQLAQARRDRETRIFQIDQSLPVALWLVLGVLATALVTLVLLATTEGLGHVLLASVFTATTVMVLVLVAMLDFPFEGSVSLSPASFAKLLADTSRMVAGG